LVIPVYKKSDVVDMLREAGVRHDDLTADNLKAKIAAAREKFLTQKFAQAEEKQTNAAALISRGFYGSKVYRETAPQAREALHSRFAFFYSRLPHVTTLEGVRTAIEECNVEFADVGIKLGPTGG
jgi:hypothetical protein